MTVRGASELRVKESDRIAMLARGFRALGIRVDEYDDGFTIHGGRPRRRRGRRRRAIIGWRWRSRLPAPPPPRRCRFTGADAVAVSYPGFFTELRAALRKPVTTDKIYLVGFMAAGKTTVARELGAAARLARRGHRRADRSARADDRRRHLRAGTARPTSAPSSARFCACCCRCDMRWSPPAAAHSWIPTTAPPSTSTALSVWLDVPLATLVARLPPDGRRPLAADRAQMERLYRCAPDRLRSRAPADRRRRRTGRSDRRAGSRTPPDRMTVRYLILSDMHANLDAFEAVLDRRRWASGTACSCSAISSATAPSRTW